MKELPTVTKRDPYDERDENSGRFTPEFRDRDFLEALREAGGATTSETAEAVGCKYRTAYARLGDLRDEGRVSSREIGNSLLWQTSDDETAREPAESGDVSGGLAGVDFPATREREACEAAVYAVRDYLRDDGPATMREIVSAVMPDHPLGYDVDDAVEKVDAGDRYRGAWWRKIVRPALKEMPTVAVPARGASEYRYTGEDHE